ncbi:MAG TPA: AI-2E family transporter [Xanthobacteraceae bacterium]|jgi:predicted PurR-regulated permease PerM|nr:AI-2E family transporter [Xanthobacteraceae bacterium]
MQFQRNIVFWLVALAGLIFLLWLLRPILLPFVLGMVLAYLLDPLANKLIERGVSRLVAALLILGGFLLAFVLLLLIIAPILSRQFAGFIVHGPEYARRLQALVSDPSHPWLKTVIGDNLIGSDKTISDLTNQAMGYMSTFLGSLWSKGRALISIFTLVIITPVVAFYLLCDWDRMLSTVEQLIPLPQRDTVRGLGQEIDRTISGYVRGQSGVCLILGTYYAIGLSLAGLNFGLLIGVVSGLISFIPYVGSLTALVLSLAVATAEFFPNWTGILIVLGVVLVGQFLEGNVLSPYLVGHSVGLHPVWLMFALFAFGYLFGFVGLLLAVPLAAATGVLIRFAISRYRASPFYTGAQTP